MFCHTYLKLSKFHLRCRWQIVYRMVTLTHFGPQQKFACNGTVIDHPEYGEVIQVQGDQRNNIRQFIKEVSGFTLRESNHRVSFWLHI